MPDQFAFTWRAEKTIPATVLRTADSQPTALALIGDGGAGKKISYGELSAQVRGVAGALVAQGIQPGERVAILSANRPEWGIAYLAIQHAGAICVPLDALLRSHELLQLLTLAAPRALFISGKFYDSLRERLVMDFPEIAVIHLDDTDSENGLTLDSLSTTPPIAGIAPPENAPATLIFTSGTTGAPKAVILTHRNILSNIEGVFASLQFTAADCFLSVLPLHHTFESTAGFLTPLCAGSRIVYASSLAAPAVAAELRSNGVTILVGVPLLYEKLMRGFIRKLADLSAPKRTLITGLGKLVSVGRAVGVNLAPALFGSVREKAGLKTLRLMVSGGAPMDHNIARFFEGLGFSFLEGYGMTECSPVITVNLPGRNVIGSVGPPLPNCEVRINEPNAEGIGEIYAQSESVTPGYLDDPDKTAAILRDGWLATGDLGKIVKGYLYICGRAKNLIVSAGGKNIYPEEIETRLVDCDCILEALVVGRTKPGKQGEEPHAMIFPDVETLARRILGFDAAHLQSDEVKRIIGEAVAQTNDILAEYKRIASWEIMPQEFEKTSTRKIKRQLYR